MGGSLTGRAFDAGVVYFNPGGMTALKDKTVINLGMSAVMPRTSFLGHENQQEEDDGPLSLPYHLYVTHKLKNENLSLGLSINSPFGIESKWKDNWSGRFISQTFRIRTLFIQPTAAYQINEHWSIGAGPVFATASLYHTRALPYTNSSGTESSIELDGKGSAIGANAGVYYKTEKLSVGLTYRSGFKIKIDDGNVSFHDLPSLITQNWSNNASSFSSELNIPSVYSLGAGYMLNDKLTLTLGFNMIQWSTFESLDYDIQNPEIADIKTARNWENTLSFRAGIQAITTSKLTIRGGIALDASPVPDRYMSPDIPDDERIVISGGITYKLKERFSLDASFQFENVKETRESGNIPYNFNGTYNSYIYQAGIGAQFLF